MGFNFGNAKAITQKEVEEFYASQREEAELEDKREKVMMEKRYSMKSAVLRYHMRGWQIVVCEYICKKRGRLIWDVVLLDCDAIRNDQVIYGCYGIRKRERVDKELEYLRTEHSINEITDITWIKNIKARVFRTHLSLED